MEPCGRVLDSPFNSSHAATATVNDLDIAKDPRRLSGTYEAIGSAASAPWYAF
jgi:hypothetical protein